MTEQGPTLTSELWRGFNPYNLTVGALAGVLTGVLAGALTGSGVPDLLGNGPALQGAVCGVGVFLGATLVHVGAHTWFGWRLGRGLAASRAGDHALAVKLLTLVERPGVHHYDEEGHAQAALDRSRATLRADGEPKPTGH